jgi:hypothetical protein
MSTLNRFVTSHGKRIEVETVNPVPRQKKRTVKRRKPFKPQFAQVPIYWVEQLKQCGSAAVYQLALCILLEHHKRQLYGDEIILSTKVTGLLRQTRSEAIKKMVEAKMIEVSQSGNEAVRVTKLLHMRVTCK